MRPSSDLEGPLLHILGYRVTDRRQSGGTIRLDMDEYADMMLQELAPYIPSGTRRVNTPMRHGLRVGTGCWYTHLIKVRLYEQFHFVI